MSNHLLFQVKFPHTDQKGFTLIELITVIVIIGALATIAIMQILNFREGAFNATMQSDLRSAYMASRQFHVDHPGDPVTKDKLQEYHFTASDRVDIQVVDGSETGLEMTASHPGTPKIYQVNHTGRVSEQ